MIDLRSTYKKRICEECHLLGQKSRVTQGYSRSTLSMPHSYWDEEGDFHTHNNNVTTTEYRCSKGHVWVGKTSLSCPQGDEHPVIQGSI